MKTIENKLTDLYLYNTDLINEGLPSFIKNNRREALEAFNILGLPDTGNEKYKYSNIKSRYGLHNYEKYFSVTDSCCEDVCKLPVESYEINIINGFCISGLTVLSDGVVYGSLKEASNQYPELVESGYNKIADNKNDSVSALNTMFVQDGAFIYIPKGVSAQLPISIVNCYNAIENIYIFARNLIIIEENSSLKLIIDSHTIGESAYMINNLTEVILGKNAFAEIVEFQKENDKSTHLNNFYASQPENSNLKVVVISTDGGFIRNNWNVNLEGGNAETHNYGLYIAGCGQSIDNYTNTEHRVADCTSFEKYKGIVACSGKGIFNGRILVEKDAQRTRAFQENHNLVLDDNSIVDSKPQLEIYADDVKCSHGATVGQLDENAVFYMRQRGISEEEAKKLQMYGFMNDIVGEVKIAGLPEIINRIAGEKIESL
ncbi:MAG: Fe-S cluster assembly protein SufD [Rikenellaceae bacterium]|nr:Fe-S cluster assembly protein SufD [Rikenellaceae bacterium]